MEGRGSGGRKPPQESQFPPNFPPLCWWNVFIVSPQVLAPLIDALFAEIAQHKLGVVMTAATVGNATPGPPGGPPLRTLHRPSPPRGDIGRGTPGNQGPEN